MTEEALDVFDKAIKLNPNDPIPGIIKH